MVKPEIIGVSTISRQGGSGGIVSQKKFPMKIEKVKKIRNIRSEASITKNEVVPPKVVRKVIKVEPTDI